MTRISYISIILVFAATVSVMVPAYAIPPLEQFVFQGVLKDNSGNLITGTRNIGLRLYTVSSGHTATNDATCTPPFCLWTENQTNISVSNGVFTIYAGSVNPLTKVMNFTNALYMEVIIRGSPDQVLSPRISIASVPFALAAEKASTNFNLNKYNIINASAIYAAGVINGVVIDNSSQSIAGVSTLSIGTIKSGSVVAGINSTGGINGSAITVQKGSSVRGSISNTGVVNGSSLQIEDSTHANRVTITSTGGITMSSANINLGSNFLTNSGHQIGLPSNSGTILLTNGTLSGGALSGIITGSPTLSGLITSTGGITMSSANINLGSNFLTNSGHQIGLPSNSGTILLTNGSLSSLTGNLNSVGGTFTGTVNTATAIAAPTSTNTINGIIINSGAISGVSTLTASGNITANEGLIISGGHLRTTGTAPTGTCGTITGTDNAGSFVSTATSCTITFSSPFKSNPVCLLLEPVSGASALVPIYTTSTTQITISTVRTVQVYYICMGQP